MGVDGSNYRGGRWLACRQLAGAGRPRERASVNWACGTCRSAVGRAGVLWARSVQGELACVGGAREGSCGVIAC